MRALRASGLEARDEAGRDRRPAVPRHLRRHADAVRRQRRVARGGRARDRRRVAITRLPAIRAAARRWAGTRSRSRPGARLLAGLPDPAWLLLRALVRAGARRRRSVVAAWCEYGRRFAAAIETRAGLGDAVPPREERATSACALLAELRRSRGRVTRWSCIRPSTSAAGEVVRLAQGDYDARDHLRRRSGRGRA